MRRPLSTHPRCTAGRLNPLTSACNPRAWILTKEAKLTREPKLSAFSSLIFGGLFSYPLPKDV